MTTALATQQNSQPVDFFTADQLKIIRDSFLNGASPQEATVLLELARIRRLNPITRQIHFVKRWDSNKNCEVWSAQTGIDGFRSIAERTGRYDGQDEPEFEYDAKGAIKLCRVRVHRKDISRPFVGVAHFAEYAQYKKDRSLTNMWATKGHIMIAKCAEALAFRKGFPEDMAGLYTAEEMGTEEKELNPPPAANTNPAIVTLPAPVVQFSGSTSGLPDNVKLSGTDRAKAKVAAKTGRIIDVPAGKTEEEAEKAAAEAVVETKPAEPAVDPLGIWKAMVAFGGLYNLTEKEVGGRMKGVAPNKQKLRDLNEADLTAFKGAIIATMGQPPEEPPFPEDELVPA